MTNAEKFKEVFGRELEESRMSNTEKYQTLVEKMFDEIEEMSCLNYFRHEPHLEYDIEPAFLKSEKEIKNEE